MCHLDVKTSQKYPENTLDLPLYIFYCFDLNRIVKNFMVFKTDMLAGVLTHSGKSNSLEEVEGKMALLAFPKWWHDLYVCDDLTKK